jgi:hypothetical protein
VPPEVLPYAKVEEAILNGRSHLLLGNGFSIACDPIFKYEKLYDAAVSAGLSGRAQAVFQRLGTNNFEAVMRLLEDGHWLAKNYDLIRGNNSELLNDLEIIKRALVEAVAKSHLENTGKVSEQKKQSAVKFLKPYHNVFTASYDLLLYWLNMSASDPPPYGDGFRGEWEDPAAETVVFTEHLRDNPGTFFLHGALHLFVANGEVRKHCWCRSHKPLTHLIREGLDTNLYPLFVAEGKHEKKLEQIHRSGYLSYCLSKLTRIENRLVVFGLSFGESDTHLLNAIADNAKIKELYVGLFGNADSKSNSSIILAVDSIIDRRKKMNVARKSGKDVEVFYYDSASANVWTA